MMLIGWPRAVLAGAIGVFVFFLPTGGAVWERLLGSVLGWFIIMAIPYLAVGLIALLEKRR